MKAAIGNGLMVTGTVRVAVQPLAAVTTKLMLYVPELEYVTEGFCWLDEVPLPKLQDQFEPATGVEVLLMLNVEPAQTDGAVNCAMGGVFTVTGTITVSEQPLDAIAINVTL